MQGKRGRRTLLGTLSLLLPLVHSLLPLVFPLVLSLGLLFMLSLGFSFVLSLGLSFVLSLGLSFGRHSLNHGVVSRRQRGVPVLYSNRRGSRGASGVRRPSFPVTRNTISAVMPSV